VINGADGLMLWDETAIGLFPIQSVNSLSKICCEAERSLDHRRLYNDIRMYTPEPMNTPETVASTAVNTVLDLPVDLITVVTETGKFARLIAKYRPPVPILALSKNAEVIKALQTTRGVVGHCIKEYIDDAALCKQIDKFCKDTHLVRPG
jgi:pyruvate kinase